MHYIFRLIIFLTKGECNALSTVEGSNLTDALFSKALFVGLFRKVAL